MIDALPLLLGPEGYQISRSVRLRSSASANFTRTPSVSGNMKTWTWSAWVKRGSLSQAGTIWGSNFASGGFGMAFGNYGGAGVSPEVIGVTLYAVGTVTTAAVFRDPSAWYHIVARFDSTQATQANRFRLYVNGVQQTLSAALNVTLNADYHVNASGRLHTLGGEATYFNDCYLAEVNHVDGQSLDPSSFGETDAVTGVWKPKKYTGTYGTNGFYLPFLQNTTATYGATFNGSSQYLTVPASSLFAPGTGDFTLEAWVNTASATDGQYVWSQTVSGTNYFVFSVDAAAKRASFVATTSGGGTPITSTANLVVGGWNHIAVVRQSGTVTVYCNGVGGTATSNTMDINNTTYVPTIGRYTHTASQWFNGVISNLRYVKGTAVYTSNFTPASAPLTAISGTSFLSLQSSTLVDNSVNALTITNNGSVATSIQYPFNTGTSIGNDQSGQGNNWTPNNISLANNSTYDSMLDVPTQWADGGNGRGNYAVMNPLAAGTSAYLSGGNLNASISAANTTVLGTFQLPTSGKWYWEYQITTIAGGSSPMGGIATTSANSPAVFYRSNGDKLVDATGSAYGATYTTTDTIGVAVDVDGGTIAFYKNNTLQGNITYSSAGFYPALRSSVSTDVFNINFGQRPFSYTPPSGFKALNTLNLPTPTILKGNQYFDATTYNGNGSTQSIVNSGGMQPDLVWIKARNATANHAIFDSSRGTGKVIQSNTTAAEATDNTTLTAFDSSGFSLGAAAGSYIVNTNTYTFVGWQWKEGATQGFDIVTFSQAAGAQNVAHSLGVTPSLKIVKGRQASDWWVSHKSLSSAANSYLILNGTGAASSSANFWNTGDNSSTFGIGSGINGSCTTFVAYLFAEVAGFSKFGSYTGNGSADGPFVYLGFRPRWIMFKATGEAGSWTIIDTARLGYNANNFTLYADLSGTEQGYLPADILSNGFKIRLTSTGTSFNTSGIGYIYAAFAENPFKNSLAR